MKDCNYSIPNPDEPESNFTKLWKFSKVTL
jgi:hypothetical protein